MTDSELSTALVRPTNFVYGAVSSLTKPRAVTAVPSLGPLAAFTGTFRGNGLNTIFRPDNTATPTPLPTPLPKPSDNILELNLTAETLSFSPSLGSVPNRGEVQGDIFLNGVPYLQTINDITVPTQPVGIHFEPGLWMIVPATNDPEEGVTLARMASIPHGTTINAQGTFSEADGPPKIPAVDITPFVIGTNPPKPVPFPSQTATAEGTARIPQDLAPFIAAGTLTQDILTDPNTLLRNHIAKQKITSTTTIFISTAPTAPLFGGGTDNIAFLLGNQAGSVPNANAVQMQAVFWIETVEHTIHIPIFRLGQPPLVVQAATGEAGQPVPRFKVTPTVEITEPRQITVRTTQIQHSQRVLLNFNGLSWPHVSVATLVPSDPISVPPSVWS
ncbi:MAG: hypothetical protein JOZ17_11305 [Acetobacteraceae bacterium]|nr:hypothetical protein [Acetobacteraceae bacterium]